MINNWFHVSMDAEKLNRTPTEYLTEQNYVFAI